MLKKIWENLLPIIIVFLVDMMIFWAAYEKGPAALIILIITIPIKCLIIESIRE